MRCIFHPKTNSFDLCDCICASIDSKKSFLRHLVFQLLPKVSLQAEFCRRASSSSILINSSRVMTTKMKDICRGIKHISHLFVVKEKGLEIGYPTDVKHVAHIGLDGTDGSAPSWMNEFKSGPDSGVSSVGSMGGSKRGSMLSGSRDHTWTSQDFEQSLGRQKASDIFNNFPPTNISNAPKKTKRKKGKSSSSSSSTSSKKSSGSSASPKSSSSKSSRMSRKSTLLRKEAENPSNYVEEKKTSV